MSQWFNWIEPEISLGTSQKVGFGTLNKAKNSLGMLKRDHPLFEERYWFVRHPVDRFRSLYKYIQTQAELPRLVALRRRTPYELLEYIEHHWGEDTHWKSQTDHLGEFEAVILPLESMGMFLPDFVKRQNVTKSENIELDSRTIDKILELYDQDLQLWQTRRLTTIRENLPT